MRAAPIDPDGATRVATATAMAAVAGLSTVGLAFRVGLPGGAALLLVVVLAATTAWALWWFPRLGRTAAAATEHATGIAVSRARLGRLLTQVTVTPTGDIGSGVGHLELWLAGGRRPVDGPVRLAGTRSEVAVLTGDGVRWPLAPGRWVGQRGLQKGQIPDRPR